MKYLITESQYNKLRFARRVGVYPKAYIMELVKEKDPCNMSFERFIQNTIEDSLFHWMGEEDVDYITDLVQGDLWNELKSYYEESCIK